VPTLLRSFSPFFFLRTVKNPFPPPPPKSKSSLPLDFFFSSFRLAFLPNDSLHLFFLSYLDVPGPFSPSSFLYVPSFHTISGDTSSGMRAARRKSFFLFSLLQSVLSLNWYLNSSSPPPLCGITIICSLYSAFIL